MQRRLERFDAKLSQSGLDALLVTGQKNIYYLTDFWGTNATVFITKNRRLFLTDSRYTLIAKQSVHGFDIIESKDPLKDIVKFVEVDKLETIGFDNQVSFAYYQALQAIFEGYTLSPQSNFMEELRMIKDEKELATIRKACSISDRAFTDVLDFIKTYDAAFSSGFRFQPADMVVKVGTDLELKEKLAGLKKLVGREKHEEMIDKIVNDLKRDGFIELENEITSTYKVVAAFGYLEELVACINISEEIQNEIPE